MLTYFIIFVIVGTILGYVIESKDTAMIIIVITSIGWAFVFGPWAIATFLELWIGYALGSKLSNK